MNLVLIKKCYIYNNANLLIININNSTIIYSNKKYDIIIIELNENFSINLFLQIDENVFEENIKDIYNNSSIYILHFSHGQNAEQTQGINKSITEDNYNIEHSCYTEPGSSGSQI